MARSSLDSVVQSSRPSGLHEGSPPLSGARLTSSMRRPSPVPSDRPPLPSMSDGPNPVRATAGAWAQYLQSRVGFPTLLGEHVVAYRGILSVVESIRPVLPELPDVLASISRMKDENRARARLSDVRNSLAPLASGDGVGVVVNSGWSHSTWGELAQAQLRELMRQLDLLVVPATSGGTQPLPQHSEAQ